MEININQNGFDGFANLGVGNDAADAAKVGTTREPKEASRISGLSSLHVSSPSSRVQTPDLASAEPVADIPDAALTRDDALGNAVKAAFNLPPPPMPAFAD